MFPKVISMLGGLNKSNPPKSSSYNLTLGRGPNLSLVGLTIPIGLAMLVMGTTWGVPTPWWTPLGPQLEMFKLRIGGSHPPFLSFLSPNVHPSLMVPPPPFE
jgi:hypothetical protein